MNIKEPLIIFGTVSLTLLAVRFVINQFVTKNFWISFVIMASISVALLVLAKKEKLGWWGKMFLRQMIKNQKGKRALFFYGEAFFVITMMLGTIYAINVGSSMGLADVKKDMIAHVPELQSQQKMDNMVKNTPPIELAKDILIGLTVLPIAVLTEFPKIAVMVSAINDTFHGWILNLYSITLIEYLEIFGMMIFYRFALRGQQTI